MPPGEYVNRIPICYIRKRQRGEICFPDLLLNAAAAAVLWLRQSATCGGNTITELYLFVVLYFMYLMYCKRLDCSVIKSIDIHDNP